MAISASVQSFAYIFIPPLALWRLRNLDRCFQLVRLYSVLDSTSWSMTRHENRLNISWDQKPQNSVQCSRHSIFKRRREEGNCQRVTTTWTVRLSYTIHNSHVIGLSSSFEAIFGSWPSGLWHHAVITFRTNMLPTSSGLSVCPRVEPLESLSVRVTGVLTHALCRQDASAFR
jgi:hypothetical protein